MLLNQTKTIWVSVRCEVLAEMLLNSQVVAPGHLMNSYWYCSWLKCLQIQGLRNLDCLTPNTTALWTLKRPKIIYKSIQCKILKGFNLNLDFSAITSNQKELWTHLFYHPESTGTKRPGAWMIIHTNKIIFWRQLLRRLPGRKIKL
jgi:hypothetical protein